MPTNDPRIPRCVYPGCLEHSYADYIYCWTHANRWVEANRGVPITQIYRQRTPEPEPVTPKKYVYEFKWEVGTRDSYGGQGAQYRFDVESLEEMFRHVLRPRTGYSYYRGLTRLRYEKRNGQIRGPLQEITVPIDAYGKMPKQFNDKLPVPKHLRKQLAKAVEAGVGGPWKKEGGPGRPPKTPAQFTQREVEF